MKKFAVKKVVVGMLFVVGVFAFTACNVSKEKAELSFQDAYTTFIESQKSDIDREVLMSTMDGAWSSESEVHLATENTTTGVDVKFTSTSLADQDNMKSSASTHVDAKVYINDEEYLLKTDVAMAQNMSGDGIKQYLKFDNLDLFLGSGNMQTAFVQKMAEPLLGKWIELDFWDQLQNQDVNMKNINTFDEYKKVATNLFKVGEILEKNVLFENKGETTYQSDLAYNVKLQPETLKRVFEAVFSGTSAIDEVELSEFDKLDVQGVLIVKDTDQIELLVNTINGNTGTTILFTEKEIIITNIDEHGSKTLITITQKSKKLYTLDIDVEVDDAMTDVPFTIQGEFDINLDMSKKEMRSEINGSLVVKSKQFIEMLGREEITLKLHVQSNNTRVDSVDIKLPDSAMLFSQILGDNFGLPYMQQQVESPEIEMGEIEETEEHNS